MPSIGDVKILVAPVYFSGADDPSPTSENIDIIKKSYFGAKSDTCWESLASYYEKSSYGKLHITGTVTTAYKDSRTAKDFETQSLSSEVVPALVDTITNSLVSNNVINPKDYDSNEDGYIDAVEIVYFTSRPLKNAGGASVWWAFTSVVDNDPDITTPTASRFFWSPYSMISSGFYTPDIDTHTLVHETGHALGLNDYYSYDNGDDECAPAGGIDMMDYNMGDHNAYSKMVLGWANPFVVDGTLDSFSLTLHSFADTGECVILRDTKTDAWNGLPYDEYLLLQYYTPTNLNEQDSKGYNEWIGNAGWSGTYKTYGLQLFHVDSRLYSLSGSYNPSTNVATSTNYAYTDTIVDEQIIDETKHTYIDTSKIAHSNTSSESLDVTTGNKGSTNCQLSIVPASKTTNFMTKNYASTIGLTNNLFGVGDVYCSSSFSMADYSALFTCGTKLNDGSSVGYSFSVTSNDASSCSISFSSVA